MLNRESFTPSLLPGFIDFAEREGFEPPVIKTQTIERVSAYYVRLVVKQNSLCNTVIILFTVFIFT